MENELKKSIAKAKTGFEESFKAEGFYNKQTRDTLHLEAILNCLQIDDGMKLLDLGTGTGYLAFPIAGQYPKTEVTGLDIVEKALDANRKKAEKNGQTNLRFVTYDGCEFPFPKDEFDIVITRYALHHFPAIHDTFEQINRVLKPNGVLFLSDPAPNDDDTQRFVDSYMQMKEDSHIKFYTKEEWLAIGKSAGLAYTGGFETHIRFPRNRQAAAGFEDLLDRFDKQVIKGYEVERIDDELWITEKVNNLLFWKTELSCRDSSEVRKTTQNIGAESECHEPVREGDNPRADRPALHQNLDSKTFRDFYYLKEELTDFCRKNGLPVSGGKIELSDRIACFLDTGEVLASPTSKRTGRAASDINEDTKIEEDFVCSERHRAFFKERIGSGFSFNVVFQTWLKNNAGRTYKEAIAAYYQILEDKKKGKRKIEKQFEYNTYIRDFFADNQGKSLEDAIACWKYKKQLRGHNRYERSDLAAIK